jgi:hypothetical protein
VLWHTIVYTAGCLPSSVATNPSLVLWRTVIYSAGCCAIHNHVYDVRTVTEAKVYWREGVNFKI